MSPSHDASKLLAKTKMLCVNDDRTFFNQNSESSLVNLKSIQEAEGGGTLMDPEASFDTSSLQLGTYFATWQLALSSSNLPMALARR